MTVILENYIISNTGSFEIRRPVNLAISAKEAQRRVRSWLCLDVNMLLTGGEPILIVGEATRWRVPVIFTAPHVGHVGVVGNVEVDAQTGLINKDQTNVETLLHATEKLSKTLPPFKLREFPAEYLAQVEQLAIPPAPRLEIQADGELTVVKDQQTDEQVQS